MKHIYIIIALLVSCTSCYRELDLEKYRPTPKMVLNSGLSPDSTISASITRTWFYTEKNPNITLKDLDVEVYINGEFKEKMWWEGYEEDESGYFRNQYNAFGLYRSSYIPLPGDKIKIIAKGELGTVSAEEVIPGKPELGNIDISYSSTNSSYYYGGTFTYKITFKDSPETEDYYMIKVSDKHSNIYLDFDYEPLLQPDQSAVDKILADDWIDGVGGAVFSDHLINGKEYTLTLSERVGINYYWPDEEEGEERTYIRNIHLYKISKAYYQYLLILQNEWNTIQKDLADLGLSEPIRYYSNIEGGTGMMGAYNGTVKTVDVTDIFPIELYPEYPY